MKPIVVQIVQHLKPGGIESLVMEILQQSKTVDYHIIALEGTVSEVLAQFPKLLDYADRIHCLNKAPGFHWQTVTALKKCLRNLQPTACVSHHIGPLLYLTIANIRLGLTHVHTEHDAWHLDNPKHLRLQKWCLRVSRPEVVADAGFVHKRLSGYFPNISLQTIYNGIDIHRFALGDRRSARLALGLPQNVKMLGCAARLEPVKRIDRLVDALNSLPDDIHLAIAGTGSQELILKQQVESLGLSNRVHFLGFVQDTSHFFQSLDVFCLVSENEGFPLSPLEAQACGIPVITTDVGGAAETLCPKTGLLLITNDRSQLVNAIKLQLNRQLVESPRSHIVRNFSLERMLQAYEHLFFQTKRGLKS